MYAEAFIYLTGLQANRDASSTEELEYSSIYLYK